MAWYSDDAVDYFSAYHTAYRWLPNVDGCGFIMSMDAIVRRTIVFVKERGYAFVLDSARDELSETFNRSVTAHWHTPFGFQALDSQTVRTKGSPGCLVAFAHGEGLKPFDIGPDYAGDDAARGELYPERYHLRARRWMPSGHTGCVGFAQLLFPFKGRRPDASVRPLDVKGGELFRSGGYEIRVGGASPAVDRLLLNPERLPGVSYRGRPLTGRAVLHLDGRRPITVA